MRRELFTIIFSLLIVLGLGIRAGLETEMVAQGNKILELEELAVTRNEQIKGLEKQLMPLEYTQPLDQIRISSGVGVRVNPLGGGTENLHMGDDLKGKKGDPVYAVLSGRVVGHWLPPGKYAGKKYEGHPIFGGYIIIDHGNQLYTI